MALTKYDSVDAFLEQVKWTWKTHRTIDADHLEDLIILADRHKSTPRIEAENEWLRKRIDDLSSKMT